MIKDLLKFSLYYSGLLSLYHNVRNKNSLTIVLFHRVINDKDTRWGQTDKEWAVTDVFFEQALVFFKKHYNPVTLEDVINHYEKGIKLPCNALLLTFDDGWKDNYDYAFPLMTKHKIPSTIFCTTGAINNDYLNWREVIYALINMSGNEIQYVFEILQKYGVIHSSVSTANEIINDITNSNKEVEINLEIMGLTYLLGSTRQMLSENEMLDMHISSLVSFGTHGHSHEPMVSIDNPGYELDISKKILSDILGGAVNSMAYPHSSVNENIYNLALQSGYKYQFGGRSNLNALDSDIENCFFSRIDINQMDHSRRNGAFSPELLSLLLFRSNIKRACF